MALPVDVALLTAHFLRAMVDLKEAF